MNGKKPSVLVFRPTSCYSLTLFSDHPPFPWVALFQSGSMSFDHLGLSEPLLRAVREQGYTSPSPIQAQAIPVVLEGRDLMAAAQTGTGKTAGFTLPLLQQMQGETAGPRQIRALVLTPTRELAAQVGESVADYGRHLGLRSAVVFGGVNINPQIRTLAAGVEILVATPGRLLDLCGQGALQLDAVHWLVLDEADRMLDMGFIHDIRKVLARLPKQRQTLLFSATFSPEIRRLARGLLKDPVEVDVAPRNSTVESIDQRVHPVDQAAKADLLATLIHQGDWQQVLVFTRTKHGANRLTRRLENNGITAAAIHGNKSQNARTRALAEFKSGEVRALVATDIAARGLDIEQLPQVVNFELPNVPEDYVHRIGRTGRAGARGRAVSLVSADEQRLLRGIERLIRQELKQEVVAGFEPGTRSASTEQEQTAPGTRRPGSRQRSRSGGGGGGGPGGEARRSQGRRRSRQRRRSNGDRNHVA